MRFISIIFIFFLWGCQVEYTQKKDIFCQDIIKPWVTPEWSGNPLDTNSNVPYGSNYFSIRNVDGINTNSNEYHLSHLKDDYALLTYGNFNYSSQHLRKVSIIEPDYITMKSEIEFEENIIGFPSIQSGKIFYASIDDNLDVEKTAFYEGLQTSDYNKTRVPLSNMIGRSRLYKNGNLINNKLEVGKELDYYSKQIYDWESHITINSTGDYLFFASNRDGGFGGTDIWYLKLNKSTGEWVGPFNPGEKINTPLNEISPFINSADNRLYFSSNGKPSVGGFDIHFCDIKKEFWSTEDFVNLSDSKNLGFPINTESNEIFPNTDTSINDRFYYASDQNGGKGGFDIWVYYKRNDSDISTKKRKEKEIVDEQINVEPEIVIDIANPNIKVPTLETEEEIKEVSEIISIVTDSTNEKINKDSIRIRGKVISDDNIAIPNVDVEIIELPDGEIQISTKTNDSGEYDLFAEKGEDLQVIAKSNNYFYDNFVIRKEEQDNLNVIERTLLLNLELTIRINFPYDVYEKPYPYTLDEDGNETKQQWQKELDAIAENIKKSGKNLKKVILVGHTDPVGSVTYNNNLGLNRVKFVVSELEKRGIDKNLLSFRSAGKTEPLPKKEGEQEEIYHKRLRRVTLKKIYN